MPNDSENVTSSGLNLITTPEDKTSAMALDVAASSGDAAEGQRQPPSREHSEALAKLRVMLVEDEPEDGQIIVKHLSALGIKKVVWVKSAVQALFQLREDKDLFPDVLITELALAGTNGIQLLAKLRIDPDLTIRTLPAIVITSVDTPSIYRRATKQAISAYLRKPLADYALKQGLQRASERKVLDIPLEFGRSWLDEGDEIAEAKEGSGFDEPGPSTFVVWLLSVIFGQARSSTNTDSRHRVDTSV
jgi:CheY-like chemotaxis protein